MEMTDDLQSEVEGGMLKLASWKSVPVMTNCAALRDPEKTRSLGLPVLKGEIGGREVDVMRDTGCEGVVVRKQLVDASQLTGKCCLLLRIDNTALLAEKAVISLRTPFLSGEVKALYIPDAICDVIVGNVEGARSPEDPGMSVMVGAATTRAQAKREAVTKPLRVPDIERHVGVDREQLIKLQQEDPRILALVDAGRTSRRGGKVVSFEKARGVVYRRYLIVMRMLYKRPKNPVAPPETDNTKKVAVAPSLSPMREKTRMLMILEHCLLFTKHLYKKVDSHELSLDLDSKGLNGIGTPILFCSTTGRCPRSQLVSPGVALREKRAWPHAYLIRLRTISPHFNLGGPREYSEGALQAASAGELYPETNKVRAWGSSAWKGNNQTSERKRGESSG
ncbi:hypothetical protein PoB_001220300 [Plakobranchus ocellatus]|uniref:DNA-directed RNA polymerase n=1 Tax=Plakobranchus ocellatus TaxID=259542 RepID=A0AAV3YT19_9GAST|nr:hypothetical protein PoB_001220300 [Plakobranchus ocellatus]